MTFINRNKRTLARPRFIQHPLNKAMETVDVKVPRIQFMFGNKQFVGRVVLRLSSDDI